MNILKPHISLNVAKVDVSIAFYEKLFGVEPKSRREGHASFDLTSPPLFLVLDEKPRTGVNADHFGILLNGDEDLVEAAARIDALEIASTRAPNKVWVKDPDGNAWEFFVRPATPAQLPRSGG